MADAMIASGAVKYALVCTGERPSLVTKGIIDNLKKSSNPHEFKLSIGAFSVGDAGGAFVVGPSEGKGFMTFGSYSESQFTDLCYYKWAEGRTHGAMNMGKITAVTLRAHKKIYSNTLNQTGWKSEDIDCLISHQVGEKYFDKISEAFKIPVSKMTKSYERYGNVATASIPLNWELAKNEGRIKSNSKIWMAMSEPRIGTSHIGLAV